MKVGFIGGKFLPLHHGHIYAMTQAFLQVDKLYVVLSSSEAYEKELCKRDGIKYMPADERLSWLGWAIASYIPKAEILHIADEPGAMEHDWEYGAGLIKALIPEKITHIFGSESSYAEKFERLYPGAEYVIIDEERKEVPISGTAIRKDVFKNWSCLWLGAQRFFQKKIAIVGTESCGKTTLARKLAKFYNTSRVEEVGRDFCRKYHNQLTTEMFDDIAMQHWLSQQNDMRLGKCLFVDSDAVITKYYLNMYKAVKESAVIDAIIAKQDYDLVLYLEPDVPWVNDGLRFAGASWERKKNNKILKKMYKDHGIEFTSISGTYEERTAQARKLVNELIAYKEY